MKTQSFTIHQEPFSPQFLQAIGQETLPANSSLLKYQKLPSITALRARILQNYLQHGETYTTEQSGKIPP